MMVKGKDAEKGEKRMRQLQAFIVDERNWSRCLLGLVSWGYHGVRESGNMATALRL